MIQYLVKRLLLLLPIMLGVLTIVTLAIHFVPGDPVDVLAGEFATSAQKTVLRERLHLDKSIVSQLTIYLSNLSHGDFGKSLVYDKSVLLLMSERILPTLELACIAIFLALFFSIPLGFLSAYKAGTITDLASSFIALIGVSMPSFWLGPILILIFSLKLDLLPVSEKSDFKSFILPSLTLGLTLMGILMRMTRTSLLENLQEDYVRTARAKGASEKRVWFVHIFRNSLIPIITIVGLQFGVLLTGAIITEKIFDWPGLGSLFIDAVGNRDYPLVQGIVLLFSFSYVIVNLMTDVLYAWADPRINIAGKK